jgi:hypothetical protein
MNDGACQNRGSEENERKEWPHHELIQFAVIQIIRVFQWNLLY